MAVSVITLPHHFALGSFQGSEERRGAIPLVIVGYCTATAFLHRQARLCTIQCLNLAFLINT